MAKSKAIIWLVGLIVYSGWFGIAKPDDSVDVRLVAEAKGLFRAVLADEPPSQDCELEPAWQRYSIPESVGREYFGLKAHAELSAPLPGPRPTDILDLAAGREFVCNDDRAKSIEGERLRHYEASEDKQLLVFRRTKYTFPVFSDDYTSAALVVSHISQGWDRGPDGIKRLPVQGVGYVAVYKKIEGTWRRISTVELFAI